MTALYGFASKNDKLAFMGADNIEYFSGRKVEKILFIEERYAIGIYGQDTPKHVIEAIKVLSGAINIPNHESIQSLLQTISRTLFRLSQCLYPYYKSAVEKGSIPEEHWDILQKESLSLAILDCLNYELYKVELGSFFPPKLSSPQLQELLSDRLHLFALAASGKEAIECLSANARRNPIQLLRDRIHHDKSRFQNKVGDLGSHIMVTKDHTITYSSAFSDAGDYIYQSYKNAPLGFSINGGTSFEEISS